MRTWPRLKEVLNEEKFISRTKLVKQVHSTTSYNTIYKYIDILRDAGFIKTTWEEVTRFEGVSIPHCKLIRKIPKKLTIADAQRMKNKPWLVWFKYPEE